MAGIETQIANYTKCGNLPKLTCNPIKTGNSRLEDVKRINPMSVEKSNGAGWIVIK